MRRSAAVILALFLALPLAGCFGGSDSDDVRDTIKGFAGAVRGRDYQAICAQYLANDIRTKLNDQGGCPDRVRAVVGPGSASPNFELEIESVKVEGKTAEAKVRTSQGRESATATLALKKEGGDWHVAGLP